MNAFRQWYTKYYTEITWFVIGWLGLAAVYDISHGNWPGLAFDLVLIAINVVFWKK